MGKRKEIITAHLLPVCVCLWAMLIAASVCGGTTSQRQVRPPAVAGAFYPAEPSKLQAMVDTFLSGAEAVTTTARLRALIAPHAGYVYSGPVAGKAYAAVKPGAYHRVIVLAPSHFADFNGVAITPADYKTPLGRVELDPLCEKLATMQPFSFSPECIVQAPQWAVRSETERPDTYEHSLEVQLPFLQRRLGKFSLVPLICGRVRPQPVAEKLAEFLDDSTLVVASSDLSHYHPYEVARERDLSCVRAICTLDEEKMAEQEACGKIPILVVMHLARKFGWHPVLFDYRNSGDTTGDKTRGVVGYAAIGFYADEQTTTSSSDVTKSGKGGAGEEIQKKTQEVKAVTAETTVGLTREEGRLLVRIARAALEEAVRYRRRLHVDVTTIPMTLREKKGCFVTLTIHGELRGCIGHIFPKEPLYEAVIDNAWAAALEDPRFPPVAPYELPHIEVEVSVLTVPRPLPFSSPEDLLAKLRPHRDGVVLKIGSAMATFLPQVWEQLPDKEQFLAHLSRKAGCAADAWRGKDVSVMIYEVQAFHESEF